MAACVLLVQNVVVQNVVVQNIVLADTWVVAPKPSEERRLAPELFLVQQSDAELVGMSCQGKAVFRGKAHCKNRVQSMAVSISQSDQIPEVTRKATRLLLSYQTNGERPSDETLANAGLRKVEDYQQGLFLIVEPVATVTATTVNSFPADGA